MLYLPPKYHNKTTILLLPLVTVATNEDVGTTTATPGHEYCNIKGGEESKAIIHILSSPLDIAKNYWNNFDDDYILLFCDISSFISG